MTTELSAEREAAFRALIERIRSKQNFALGAVGGIVGASLGALAWASVSAATGYSIGYVAVGIGWLVGYGVRTLGGGMSKSYGYLGAALSLAGCVAGNFGALVAGDAKASNIPLGTLLSGLDPGSVFHAMTANFDVMDVLFYGISLYFGYKYSIRRLTKDEIAALPG
jgi:hypothetical protein